VPFLVLLTSSLLALPALASRDLPTGAEPTAVLNAFFSDLKTVLGDPSNSDLGLNATYVQVDGYWIRTSREHVQQTGQVADLNSVMFFKMNRPTEWNIGDVRLAGDFARAKVTFIPSASSGVVRDRDYEPIEATFNLVSQNGDWFIVDFRGPQREPRPPQPDALVVDGSDTPETLVTRFMDIVIADLGPSSGPPSGNKLGGVVTKVKDMWADTNDARRSLGQSLGMMAIMQPMNWSLTDKTVNGDEAEVSITFESGSPFASSMQAGGGGNGLGFTFRARREAGIWKLEAVRR
jgi:hypothetical protein